MSYRSNAKRVGLTQSAMSHALGRLRAQFDDPLFQATPRGLQPTARAHALAPPLGEALALVRRAVAAQAPFSPRALRRTFNIGTTDYGELAVIPRFDGHVHHVPVGGHHVTVLEPDELRRGRDVVGADLGCGDGLLVCYYRKRFKSLQ